MLVSVDRYARQLRAIGPVAHARIRAAKVLVVGLGGLGCPAATYLAGAGVARLGLVDHDLVEESNLHRQPLYTTADVGRSKVEAARTRLAALNPDVTFASIKRQVKSSNAADIVQGWDLVLDCTDSMEARYALSDACLAAGIPLIQGGVAGQEGQVAILCGRDGPCYRCLHATSQEGPACADEGVLGPLPGVVGSVQALWSLQLLGAGPGASQGQLLIIDADGSSRSVALKRRDGCKAHVSPPSGLPMAPGAPAAAVDRRDPLVSIDGTDEGPACPLPWNAPQGPDIGVEDFAAHRDAFFLLDVREPDEHEEFAISGDVLIPLRDLPGRVEEVPKERDVVVYCAVGGRSGRAAEWLRQRGYKAYNLRGGVRAWMMAGLA